MLISRLAPVAGFIATAALAAAIGPCATAAPLTAAPDDQVVIKVSTADLNMSSEAGARAALQRIQYAASEICGGDAGDRRLGEQMMVRSCVAGVIKRAVASANLPTLSALSEGRPLTPVVASADR